jgi:tetratricopeptide (TPR) repeat protein
MSRRRRSRNSVSKVLAARPGTGNKGFESSATVNEAVFDPAASLNWKSTLLAFCLVVAAALAAYHNSFNGPFIFDDSYWIVENPSIRQLWPIEDVLFSKRAISYGGRPVVGLSLAVDYAIWGMNTWAYHATNLLFHVLAAFLLFGVIRQTLLQPRLAGRFAPAATGMALAAALIWTVHPLQTSAVTYVIQRTEVLVSLFYLLVLYCVIRGATAPGNHSKIAELWYLGAVVAVILGAATKEVILTAPLVVLLYDRTFLSGSFWAALARRWGLYLSLVATWGIIAWVVTATRFHAGSTGFDVAGFTWWSYLLTQPSVILHYLRAAVWPTGLALDYEWPPAQGIGDAWPAALVIITLLALTTWALVKRPVLGFLPAAFFLILAPTSSFIPILDACFDHRMYLALAVPVVGVVVTGYLILDRWLRLEHAGDVQSCRLRWAAPLVAVAAVVLALCTATILRNDDFRSDISIWQDTVSKRPENSRAHNGLADALAVQGHEELAIAEYERALMLKPDFVEPLESVLKLLKKRGGLGAGIQFARQVLAERPQNPAAENLLAGFLAADSRFEEADAAFRRSLELDSENIDTRIRLADLYLRRGNSAEASVQYEEILERRPYAAEARADYAHALILQNRLDEAIRQAQLASELKPDLAPAHVHLAAALGQLGKVEDAVAEYQTAIEIAPDVPETHHELGSLLASHGRTREAVDQYRQAIALRSAFPEAHNNLSVVLDRLGKHIEAIAECRIALALNPQYPEAHNNLGAMLSNQGKLDEAESHLRMAIMLRPDYPEAAASLDGVLKRRRARDLNSPH